MKLSEAKQQFIQAWGTMGSQWGISRTMAQVHALLMISEEPLSAEDVMEQLNISRGNVNMTLRALIDWGLAEKKLKLGERKEFFVAEKEMWKVARQIILERRKREIEPLKKTLVDLKTLNAKDAKTQEGKAFLATVKEIDEFTQTADKLAEKLTKSDRNWFFNKFMKIIS